MVEGDLKRSVMKAEELQFKMQMDPALWDLLVTSITVPINETTKGWGWQLVK